MKINATYVPMTNHMDKVRELTFQGRLSQWNTCEIYATNTLEEALTRVEELPTVF